MPEESVTIVVQVQPNANENKVVRFEDGALHLRISAPPTKGKANRELLKFLSTILGISKVYLTIEKGMTSKKKIVAVRGLTQNQVTRRLEQH
jgi:hypothetical protein